jgi:diguanylate cyclase (GGDEF)-like protein
MSEQNTQAVAAAAASLPWRILLVDDEPTQRLIMARFLRRAGYDVETAGNGREALERLKDGGFQLLITDWEMPEMDGATLCSAVRSSQFKGYVYTILLTARDAKAHIVAGLQSGADDYLTKPVDEPELIARLNTGKRIVELERNLRDANDGLRVANEENRRLSITDALTGAYNRRYLMDQLPREIERAARYGRELSVIMCDVDHFKKINDTFGHLAGDEVLKQFVEILQRSIRSSDWVTRYGGEEFVIVLPETSVASAETAAEHLRDQVSKHAFHLDGAIRTVTASFGVTGWRTSPFAGTTLDAVIAACDAGIYSSKAAGRNRVTTSVLEAPAGASS